MKNVTEMTKEDLLSDEVVKDIFSGKTATERDRISVKYMERAKELKFITEFRRFLKSAVDDEKEARALATKISGTDVQRATFEIGDNSYTFNTPGWIVDQSGIYRVIESSGMKKKACYRPMFIRKVLRNIEDQKEKVKLCYLDGNKVWREKIFDRSIVSSGSKITMLSSYGVDVTTESSKALVEFLSDVENNNLSEVERGLSTSKFGWKMYEGERKFIPYDTEIEFDSNERFHSLSCSIKERGSYDTWLKLAKKIRSSGRKEPFIYLIAAFSSVLVQPLNCLPYIVNLWTETGKGKTVALMFACSVWGNPDEGNYLTDPTSTRTALEQRCTALNNLPMMIDDLSKMKDGVDVDFTNMIYFLCGGKGKERSNVDLGVEVVGTWKNCILTNMERPLATETMRGGAVNRILDFQSEEGSYFMFDGRDKGREIVKTLKENYGFAGRLFVEIIKNLPAQELKEKYEAYVTVIKDFTEKQGTQKEEKQISPMAILLLTDELIEQHIFKDGQRLDVEWCVNQLKNCDQVSENQRAYEDLMSDVMANSKLHFNPDSNAEQWGFSDGDYVWLFPGAFRTLANKNNFSTTALCNWAYKQGLMLCDKEEGRVRYTKNKRVPKTNIIGKYYVFKLPSKEFNELTEEEVKELPFT